jgi:hypothetical protein
MTKPKNFTWANHQGQVYQVLDTNAIHVLILHPRATGVGSVNVALNGRPVLVPGLCWAAKEQCHFYPVEHVEALPPIPYSGGLQVGTRCRWGTSLGEWAVLAISGNMAKVRQVTGWAEAIIHDAPVAELRLLSTEVSPLFGTDLEKAS